LRGWISTGVVSFGLVKRKRGGIIWSSGPEFVDLEIKVVWGLKIFTSRMWLYSTNGGGS
jgi:hypothetical protein